MSAECLLNLLTTHNGLPRFGRIATRDRNNKNVVQTYLKLNNKACCSSFHHFEVPVSPPLAPSFYRPLARNSCPNPTLTLLNPTLLTLLRIKSGFVTQSTSLRLSFLTNPSHQVHILWLRCGCTCVRSTGAQTRQ